MPRFPDFAAETELRKSVFARLADRLAKHQGKVFPLHIGDTCYEPPVQTIDVQALSDLSRYGHPTGTDELIAAVIDKVRTQNQIEASSDNLQITVGATQALFCAARVALSPGDECLLLSPYWPLIRGIVNLSGGNPVDVPFSDRLSRDPGLDPVALVEPLLTDKTTAIYLTTPNNPDGTVLSRAQLSAIGRFAEQHRLWILSDECYENYVYEGEHVSIASLGLSDRTMTAFSFSKSFAMAGLRLGALVGPRAAMARARRVANHTVYNVPVVLQRVALLALTGGRERIAPLRKRAMAARDYVAKELEAPFVAPAGGAYVFCDFSSLLGNRGIDDLLDAMLDEGVALAPGLAFGAPYERWARICFTSCDEDDLREAIDRINRVLAAWA